MYTHTHRHPNPPHTPESNSKANRHLLVYVPANTSGPAASPPLPRARRPPRSVCAASRGTAMHAGGVCAEAPSLADAPQKLSKAHDPLTAAPEARPGSPSASPLLPFRRKKDMVGPGSGRRARGDCRGEGPAPLIQQPARLPGPQWPPH